MKGLPYASNASVQVMLFSDRLEVWNPGELPLPMTIEALRKPHASMPRNPLVCDPMFLTRYAEKAGSGVLDMTALCRDAGLPELEFRQTGGPFVQTIWRPKISLTPQVTEVLGAAGWAKSREELQAVGGSLECGGTRKR
jgi:predicted HTH transcriptional regulator